MRCVSSREVMLPGKDRNGGGDAAFAGLGWLRLQVAQAWTALRLSLEAFESFPGQEGNRSRPNNQQCRLKLYSADCSYPLPSSPFRENTARDLYVYRFQVAFASFTPSRMLTKLRTSGHVHLLAHAKTRSCSATLAHVRSSKA